MTAPIWKDKIFASGSFFGTRTDQLDLRLDLTGTTTFAGDYLGTLNLQAIVQ